LARVERSPVTSVLREPESTPTGALVLTHGRGADPYDLEPLLEILDPARKLLGILPRGPLLLPPGGRHWYIVRQIGFPDPPTFLASFRELADHLSSVLQERGLSWDRTVLGGFSMGAVMSYALSLGADRPRPAGVLAFSGFIPSVEGFDLALADREGLPVSISHGTLDPVIGVNFGRDARDQLAAAGLAVHFREDPVGHTIAPPALAQAKGVLEEALSV
jgi:phospholipase/carboxylesterase